ncbi:MAG: hypothetical protein RIT47_735 [Pseudomonadota bacterium]
MSNKSPIVCHLTCKVIDFFGDIGVAWRIAKQLKVDFNIEVHLLVDDLVTTKRLIPYKRLMESIFVIMILVRIQHHFRRLQILCLTFLI